MDARGRKQYRYHDLWRERRDRRKFGEMLEFARALPELREQVERDLRRRKISRERVLACAVRLLDRGFFRIGSEDYAEVNETYGIATMRKRHVTVTGERVVFDYEAKGGKRRVQWSAIGRSQGWSGSRKEAEGGTSCSPIATEASGATSARRDQRVHQGVIGERHSAKDFRTWNATVLAAVVLAGSARERDMSTKGGRNRAKRDAVKQVAQYLGNTPAVCRASYIDPRVFDRFDGGMTVGGVFDRLPENPRTGRRSSGRSRRPCSTSLIGVIPPAIERLD